MPVQQVVKDADYYQKSLVAGELRRWTDDAWLPEHLRLKPCMLVSHSPGGECEVLTEGQIFKFAWHYILDKTRPVGGDDVEG